jgi:hypothetical protein
MKGSKAELRHVHRGPLDKTDVDRARRAAAELGYRVEKSRDRYQHHNNRGGLMLLTGDTVLAGANYDLTPEDVVDICDYIFEEEQD